MPEEKLSQVGYNLASRIINLEKSAGHEYFRNNLRVIKKRAARDNRLGMTLGDLGNEEGFRRHWDPKIKIAMGQLNNYFFSVDSLIGLNESGNYSKRSLDSLKSGRRSAIESLNCEFWSNPESRNSFVARIRYIPMLNMLLPDVVNFSNAEKPQYYGGVTLG